MLDLLSAQGLDAADDSERLGIALQRCHAELALGNVACALDLARKAELVARDANRASEEVEALALGAEALAHQGRHVEAVEHAALGVRLGGEGGCRRRELALAHASHAIALSCAGAFTLARRCCESLDALSPNEDATGIWPDPAEIEGWVNALERAERVLSGHDTPLLDTWPGADDRPLGLVVSAWQAVARTVDLGDWPAALRQCALMLERAERAQHLPLQVLALRFAAHAHRALGEHREEADSLRRVSGLLAPSAPCWESLQASAAQRALLRTAEGRIDSLRSRSQQLEQWAFQDELTGLANTRRFNEELGKWSARPDAERPALCVAFLDVDRFKQINDRFSHAVGNDVLRAVASRMQAHVREGDLAVRWAGDEFAILFPGGDLETVRPIADRLRTAIGDHGWNGIAPGLSVSVSVGLVEALPGDDHKTLLERSDKAMYHDKRLRARRQVERQVPRAVLTQVARWVRRARHMVVFVGAGHFTEDTAGSGDLANWSPRQQADFGHAEGWRRDPDAFHAFWREWRKQNDAHRKPAEVHQLLRKLQQRVPSVDCVTERVDGLLAMAGINNVLALYGDAYRDRCDACGVVYPSRREGRCLSCSSPRTTIRPDIVLLGERPNERLMAAAEFSAKRADVILVVDSDLLLSPSAGMIEKARTRGARVVMFGHDRRSQRHLCDVSVAVEPAVFLEVLLDALDASRAEVVDERLSEAGMSSMCFLTGQGVDDRGRSLKDVLAWSDWDLERDLRPIPWMFPLTTPSRMDPSSPVPTADDFAVMAADPLVVEGVRQAFHRMLEFYGFEWNDGVRRSSAWSSKAPLWADQAGHHDQFLSRIIGALSLLGLRSEGRSLLMALETEVGARRGPRVALALRHWQLASAAGSDASAR